MARKDQGSSLSNVLQLQPGSSFNSVCGNYSTGDREFITDASTTVSDFLNVGDADTLYASSGGYTGYPHMFVNSITESNARNGLKRVKVSYLGLIGSDPGPKLRTIDGVTPQSMKLPALKKKLNEANTYIQQFYKYSTFILSDQYISLTAPNVNVQESVPVNPPIITGEQAEVLELQESYYSTVHNQWYGISRRWRHRWTAIAPEMTVMHGVWLIKEKWERNLEPVDYVERPIIYL